jgi:hypothetical protein
MKDVLHIDLCVELAFHGKDLRVAVDWATPTLHNNLRFSLSNELIRSCVSR